MFQRFTLACIFSMFLVLSSSTTFLLQPAQGARPTAYASVSTPLGPLINTGTITIPPGQTSIPVTIRFSGTEDDDRIVSFRCTLYGLPLGCPSMLADWIDPRNKIGTITLNLGPRAFPYTFTVASVNDRPISTDPIRERERISDPYTFSFTIRTSSGPSPISPSWTPTSQDTCGDGIDNNANGQIDENCPRLRIIARDNNDNDISGRTTVGTHAEVSFWATSPDGRPYIFCDSGVRRGPLPNQVTFDREIFTSCTPHIRQVPHEYLASRGSTRLNIGSYWFCGIVLEHMSGTRSTIECTEWERVQSTNPPPIIHLTNTLSLSPSNVASYLPHRGVTPNNIILLSLRAEYPSSQFAGHAQEIYFDCAWDGNEYRQCGQRFGSQNTLVRVDGVSNGNHGVFVKARYSGSSSSLPIGFSFCVSPAEACVPNRENRMYNPIGLFPFAMAPAGAGINGSSIIPDAGLNKIIIENEKAKISGGIIAVNANTVDNKTEIDSKSLSWKQTEGPEVKLNSTESQNVEFLAPSVENDTLMKLNFTVTDPNGKKATDTVSLFLATEQNAEKYNGTFCDAMVTKALEHINYAKDKDNTDSQTLRNTQLAKNYLTECSGSYQHANQSLRETLAFFNETGTPFSDKNIPLGLQPGKAFVDQGKVIDPAIQDDNTESPVSQGADSITTTEDAASKGGGSTVDTSEPIKEEQKQEAAESGGAEDETSNQIATDKKPLPQESKPDCPAGETYIPGEGCAPS